MVLIGPRKRRFGPVCTAVGKTWLAYSRQCASIRTIVQGNLSRATFFFSMHPPTNGGVLDSISWFPVLPPPPPMGPHG